MTKEELIKENENLKQTNLELENAIQNVYPSLIGQQHYLGLSRLSERVDFVDEEVIYGKSNTDQSFFEPTSSLIANAERQGSLVTPTQSQSEKLSDEKLFDSVIYTKGMTFEESAQMETDLKQTLEIQQQKLAENINQVAVDVVQNSIKKD